MITIPNLDPCTDILDTDLLLITHTNGNSEKMTGAEFNKRNQVIISANTTLTGTPLKTGNVVRVLFTADQSAANNSTTMAISYNSTNYTVKVCKNGALANYLPFEVSTGVYEYCQAYTALELLYDGTNFIIMGNPVVFSDTNTTTFANGMQRVNTVASNDKGMVTSGGVYTALSEKVTVHKGYTPNTASYTHIKISFSTSSSNNNAVIFIQGTSSYIFYAAVFQSYNQGGSSRTHITEIHKGTAFGTVDKSNEGYILIPYSSQGNPQAVSVFVMNANNSTNYTIEFVTIS